MAAIGSEESGVGEAAAGKAGGWLALAASPGFALMALAAGLTPPAPMANCPAMADGAMAGGLSLTGMVPMYLLMSLFHAGPWLRLMARRRKKG